VAATSSFDSIVAAVALVATVFGIYELSSICSSAIVTATHPYVTSYPTQIDIPVYLLLTTVVGAIMLALTVRFLRHPIGTSIRVDDKICDPAEESEHYYDESEHYYDGERPTVPRGKRLYCDPSSREGRLHQRQTSLRLDAEADDFAASIRLQAEANVLAATAPSQPRPAAPNTSPTLRAFVSPYRHTVAQLEALDATVPTTMTLTQMSDLVAQDDTDISPVNDDRTYSPGDDNESYREWYIRQYDYSPASSNQSPNSVVPEPRQEGSSEFSPVSDDEEEPRHEDSFSPVSDVDREQEFLASEYNPTRRQYLRDGFRSGHASGFVDDSDSEAVLSDSASDDDEEEEEMDDPSPRDIRAARRSCVRGAFHLTLLLKSSQTHRRLEPRIRRVSRLASLRHQPYFQTRWI
jgi:hypothetical protein